MNNVEQNYFRDGNSLVHGYFPQIEFLSVYYGTKPKDDKNGFSEQCFPAKMQAASLK
jgi:hypothetical protein